jgi:hypothetical protein
VVGCRSPRRLEFHPHLGSSKLVPFNKSTKCLLQLHMHIQSKI